MRASLISTTLFLFCLFEVSLASAADKSFVLKGPSGEKIVCAPKGKSYISGIKRSKKFVSYGSLISDLKRRLKRSPASKKLKKQIVKYKALKLSGDNLCKYGPSGPPLEIPPSLDKLDRAVTREDVRYLLEKAGFGMGPSDENLVTLAASQGIEALVDEFMKNHDEPAGLLAEVADRLDGQIGSSTTQTPAGQRAALLKLWARTNNPYAERLALFLLSVWTVAGDVISDETFRGAFWDYYTRLRTYASNDTLLPDMAVEITKDPLMLLYLNNDQNVKGKPNENYARELMELFTLGTEDLDGNPNYSETKPDGSGDIAVAARMLTGFKPVHQNYGTGKLEAIYDSSLHQNGPHTMFQGKPYAFSGEGYEDLVRGIFAHHPNVKIYYAREILKEYLTPNPPSDLVQGFAQVIENNGYKLRPAMKTLLQSAAFYSSQFKNTVPKSSPDFAVEFIRTLGLGANFDPGEGQRQLGAMGFEVNNSPSVFWFSQEGWISPSVLLEKQNLLAYLFEDHTSQQQTSPAWAPSAVLPSGAASEEELIDYVAARMGVDLNLNQKAALLDYMKKEKQYDNTFSNFTYNNTNALHQREKGLGLYYILASSPQFNLK